MYNEIKIVAIQASLVWQNPAENRRYFEQKIRQLDKDTDLVMLPEMFPLALPCNPVL